MSDFARQSIEEEQRRLAGLPLGPPEPVGPRDTFGQRFAPIEAPEIPGPAETYASAGMPYQDQLKFNDKPPEPPFIPPLIFGEGQPPQSREQIENYALPARMAVPTSLPDLALYGVGGPIGRTIGKLGQTVLGAAGIYGTLTDEAQAGKFKLPLGGLVRGAAEAPTGVTNWPGIRAYHSSPYDFDRFDLSRVGSGQGAQSYGYGHYFAENPAVSGQGGQYWKEFLNHFPPNEEYRAAKLLQDNNFDRAAAARAAGKEAAGWEKAATGEDLPDRFDQWSNLDRQQWQRQQEEYVRQGELYRKTEQLLRDKSTPVGPRTYEVNLRTNPDELIAWDKPMAQQPAQVQEILKSQGYGYPQVDLPDRYAHFGYGAQQALKNSKETAQLAEAGIPGLRYLDQASRERAAQIAHNQRTGGPVDDLSAVPLTYNYVMFDPSKIDIIKKYGLLGGTVAGAAGATALTPDQAEAANLKLPPSFGGLVRGAAELPAEATKLIKTLTPQGTVNWTPAWMLHPERWWGGIPKDVVIDPSMPMDLESRMARRANSPFSQDVYHFSGQRLTDPNRDLPVERTFSPNQFSQFQLDRPFVSDFGIHVGSPGQAEARAYHQEHARFSNPLKPEEGPLQSGGHTYPLAADFGPKGMLTATDETTWGPLLTKMHLQNTGQFTPEEIAKATAQLTPNEQLQAYRDLVRSHGYGGLQYRNQVEAEGIVPLEQEKDRLMMMRDIRDKPEGTPSRSQLQNRIDDLEQRIASIKENTTAKSYAIADPSQLRSRFMAIYDPRNLGKSFLAGSVAGTAAMPLLGDLVRQDRYQGAQ